MQLTNVKGNTWVWEGPQLVGVYQISDKTCLLLDPGSCGKGWRRPCPPPDSPRWE